MTTRAVDPSSPEAVPGWDDAHRYSPAPRHRRRLLLDLMAQLDGVSELLDAGCAQPFLLEETVERFGWTPYGCDISEGVIEANRERHPGWEFLVLDLAQERWPGDRRFDLVVSSEVLEHVPDWRAALTSLCAMSERHLLITVPCGQIRPMDRLVGHLQHFTPELLGNAVREEGLEVVEVRRWGFPMHTLYRSLVNRMGAEAMYDAFSGGSSYGAGKRLTAKAIGVSFHVNDLFRSGEQLLLRARRPA